MINDEGIHRVAGARRVNLGIKHIEVLAIKVGAYSCKQIGLIGLIDHHLDAGPIGGDSRNHNRVVFCGAFCEKPGMPGDFARFMSKKVLELKAPPEIFRRIWFTTMELE